MSFSYLIKFPHIFATALFKEHMSQLDSEHYRITLHNSYYCTIEFNNPYKRCDHIIKYLAPTTDIKLRVSHKDKSKYITIQRKSNGR